MKKNRFLTIAVIALLIINIATISFMFYRHFDRKGHHSSGEHHNKSSWKKEGKGEKGSGRHSRFVEKLDLSEQQKEQFFSLKKNHRATMDSLQGEIHEVRMEQFDLIKTGYSEEPAYNLASEIGELQKEIELATMKHFYQVKEMLNEEQKAEFNELAEKLKQRMPDRSVRGKKHDR